MLPIGNPHTFTHKHRTLYGNEPDLGHLTNSEEKMRTPDLSKEDITGAPSPPAPSYP